ncbi:MAG: hypothetical protein K8F35_13295 [Dokdonella sp.]|uniref:hypothetical protein n=1 Tax=Dokdonella sp. TaxID=2291710 RepID=UPI0025BB7F5E|nr:hypothetical protein [Dokdonella sp.]MBZ0223993.1 hypothetical protein [Dokdonella sp.]
MDGEKVIACVGVGEAELAHLRLLLRSCAKELTKPWRLGQETGADLLIVDPTDFAGGMAQVRARGTGIRCAVFSDAPAADADFVLHRPLQRGNLITLLNRVASGEARPAAPRRDAAFHVNDIGIGMVEPLPTEVERRGAPGLDDLLKAWPNEFAAEPTSHTKERVAMAPPPRFATREAMLEQTAMRTMREYLDGELLRAPARVVLGKAPALIFDPKHRMAYIAGGLHSVEAYASTRWRLCDWVPLKSAELAQAREKLAALSYAQLIWLEVLLHSAGTLARHLDPKATFRLLQWSDVDPNYGWVFRIASTMLQPLRLHEISAASGTKMGDVFNVVNAYDAIGLIESRLPDPGDKERPGKSLFGRLRARR